MPYMTPICYLFHGRSTPSICYVYRALPRKPASHRAAFGASCMPVGPSPPVPCAALRSTTHSQHASITPSIFVHVADASPAVSAQQMSSFPGENSILLFVLLFYVARVLLRTNSNCSSCSCRDHLCLNVSCPAAQFNS